MMSKELSGLLLVDKPVGWTSHDVVAYVRRVAHQKSVGHTGTLDPLASGLMIVLLGEATKLSSYFTEQDKKYFVEVVLGFETESLDITGPLCNSDRDSQINISSQSATKLASEIQEIISYLTGEEDYEIPLYSAKKIDGVRLYELAHEDKTVSNLPKKKMNFFNIKKTDSFTQSEQDLQSWIESLNNKLLKFPNDERAQRETLLLQKGVELLQKHSRLNFEIECSKGSFIRSWVQRLGKELIRMGFLNRGGATVSALRRVETHGYKIENALDLKGLSREIIESRLIPLDQALVHIKKLLIMGQDLNLLRNGQIGHQLRGQLIQIFDPEKDEYIQIHERIRPTMTNLIALIGFERPKGFIIKRVFNTARN